jgi:hypothetical protein
MALIPVGYGQVNFIFGGPALPHGAQVAIGFKNTNDAAPAVLCETWQGLWTGHIQAQTATSVILEEILVKNGPNDVGPSASVFPAMPGTGDLEDVIPSLAVLVQKRTALGGKKHRGRNYWPILSENEYQMGGTIEPSSLAAAQSAFNGFFLAAQADGVQPAILHTGVDQPTLVTSMGVSSVLATQRRRLRG